LCGLIGVIALRPAYTGATTRRSVLDATSSEVAQTNNKEVSITIPDGLFTKVDGILTLDASVLGAPARYANPLTLAL